VIDNTLELFKTGLAIQKRWRLSLWDAMILSAAQASGARELLSEDLNHGQDYGGVRVMNPFQSMS
jgi:predicted nucleic acid-binding protein